jgi:predicted nucleic acid-binding protein
VKGIADTGFLVAFANANDKHHAWAVELATGITEPLLTCEAVLAETAFHLENTSVTRAMAIRRPGVLAFDCRDHLVQLARLADRYGPMKCGKQPADIRVIHRR